jgi:hypothetical protein
MSVKTKSRYTQDVRAAVFEWGFADTMVATTGVSKDFGAADTTARIFEVIDLPPGARVVGGHLAITEAFDTAGYDLIVGDSVTADRYLATADLKSVGVSALLTPGYVNVGGLPIRLSVASDDACTTGKGVLTVLYVIDGRANEVA